MEEKDWDTRTRKLLTVHTGAIVSALPENPEAQIAKRVFVKKIKMSKETLPHTPKSAQKAKTLEVVQQSGLWKKPQQTAGERQKEAVEETRKN